MKLHRAAIVFLCVVMLYTVFTKTAFSQTNSENFKTYSYKEFFDLIEAEKDSVFELNDALIAFNWATDKDFIVNYNTKLDSVFDHTYLNKSSTTKNKFNRIIDRELRLTNVQFKNHAKYIGDTIYQFSSLYNFRFKKRVRLNEVMHLDIYNCVFESYFGISNGYNSNSIKVIDQENNFGAIDIADNLFHTEVRIQLFNHDNNTFKQSLYVSNNTFFSKPNTESQYHYYNLIYPVKIDQFFFNDNIIHEGKAFNLSSDDIESIEITDNSVFNSGCSLFLTKLDRTNYFNFENNDFKALLKLNFERFKNNFDIDWGQFKNGFVSTKGMGFAFRNHDYKRDFGANDSLKLIEYDTKLKVENEKAFLSEIQLLSDFYKYYKSNFNSRSFNDVYVKIKNLETRRMRYLHNENPNFKTFFRWQINRFLKVFSNYGTEPERAIIFSFYVIMLFAGIYLFFPNTWDEHGRKRIMDRYEFFIKYMKRDAGIHEVYLEEKHQDLLEFEEFKRMIDKSDKSIPKFFKATGHPLYKWSVLGTKTSVRWLKRFDIVSGKWSELPEKKKLWKTVLIICAFIVALIYDLLIKVLNAVMLSVNTFTTLGFGEIPIKGLPRYLAIIQGFIGWFMLTIFSVSLISQLLLN